MNYQTAYQQNLALRNMEGDRKAILRKNHAASPQNYLNDLHQDRRNQFVVELDGH